MWPDEAYKDGEKTSTVALCSEDMVGGKQSNKKESIEYLLE